MTKIKFQEWRKNKLSDKAWRNIKIGCFVFLLMSIVIVTAVITWAIAYEKYVPKDLPLVEEAPEVEILVRGTVITIDNDGTLVELDEDSDFGGLRVYIPNNDDYPHFRINDYLDIYYNGVIIDTSPARLQTIHRITKYATDIDSVGDWKRSTRKTTDFIYSDTIKPLIQATLSSDQEITEEFILGEDIRNQNIIAILVYISSADDTKAGWKEYYIQKVGEEYKIIYKHNILLPVEQLES